MFVDRFMTWSVSAGSDQRADAISRLAKSYLSDSIAGEERAATEQVLILFLDDPCPSVRVALAKVLAADKQSPRVLIWGLSQDVSEVAAIIYRGSSLLKPADLIAAIEKDDPAIQIAIAERKNIAADVVRALVKHADEQAVLALLKNQNVVLGPGLKQDVADRHGRNIEVRNLLLAEDDLPPACRQMLVQQLSKSLLSLVSDNGWVPERHIADTTNDAANRATVDIATQINSHGIGDYIAHLVSTNQMTPALLVRAICEGNAAFFEAAIAEISGTSLKRVQAIIDANRPAAFRALFNRTGMPKNVFPVIKAALAAWRLPDDCDGVLMDIVSRLDKDDAEIDPKLFAMLSRMVTEQRAHSAKQYDRQLLLEAA